MAAVTGVELTVSVCRAGTALLTVTRALSSTRSRPEVVVEMSLKLTVEVALLATKLKDCGSQRLFDPLVRVMVTVCESSEPLPVTATCMRWEAVP